MTWPYFRPDTLFRKTAKDIMNPTQEFIFKRLDGTKDLYTIRNSLWGGRYLSIESTSDCNEELSHKDKPYGWSEVW